MHQIISQINKIKKRHGLKNKLKTEKKTYVTHLLMPLLQNQLKAVLMF